jgi:hypothetical protein
MTRPIYGIEGTCWQVSFQRYVAGPDTVSPHRGALPCHGLEEVGGVQRVLVPLPSSEALWVAWTVPAGIGLAGSTRTGEQLRIVTLVGQGGPSLVLAANGVCTGGRSRPIDRDAVNVADAPEELVHTSLRFVLTDAGGKMIAQVEAALCTVDLYEQICGPAGLLDASPGNAYGKWRLP